MPSTHNRRIRQIDFPASYSVAGTLGLIDAENIHIALGEAYTKGFVVNIERHGVDEFMAIPGH